MILASICVRAGSKGVPLKNIKMLNGNPLLFYTVECAKKSKLIDDIIISSDSEKMIEMGNNYGIKYSVARPPELATDGASKWDVFIHLIEEFEKISGKIVDYVVDLDVTVPLRLPEHIDGAINLMLNSTADVVITGYEPERNPYFNMMEVVENNFAKIVKKSEKPIVCRQDAPQVFSLTPAVYVIKKQALYDYKHWSDAKCLIFEIPRKNAIDIDTEFDFELVEYLMKKENE